MINSHLFDCLSLPFCCPEDENHAISRLRRATQLHLLQAEQYAHHLLPCQALRQYTQRISLNKLHQHFHLERQKYTVHLRQCISELLLLLIGHRVARWLRFKHLIRPLNTPVWGGDNQSALMLFAFAPFSQYLLSNTWKRWCACVQHIMLTLVAA